MSYIARAGRALRETADLVRDKGVGAGLRLLREKLFAASTSLWFERPAAEGPVTLPAGMTIAKVVAADAERYRADLVRAGAATELRHFKEGATAYVAYWQGEPVGAGWCFPHSPLVRRLGVRGPAVYLGSYYVRESARGHGIYPALLRAMCRDLPPPTRVFLSTALHNRPSQRGVAKAGVTCRGRLRVVVVAGVMVYCRVRPGGVPEG